MIPQKDEHRAEKFLHLAGAEFGAQRRRTLSIAVAQHAVTRRDRRLAKDEPHVANFSSGYL